MANQEQQFMSPSNDSLPSPVFVRNPAPESSCSNRSRRDLARAVTEALQQNPQYRSASPLTGQFVASSGNNEGEFLGAGRSQNVPNSFPETGVPTHAAPQAYTGEDRNCFQSVNHTPDHLEAIQGLSGRESLPVLHPDCINGATWFGAAENHISDPISRMLNGMFKEPGHNWSDVPPNTKRLWFHTFAQHYQWAPGRNETVRKLFYKEAAGQMRRRLSQWKLKWKLPGRPKPRKVLQNVWEGLCAYWDIDETKKVALSKSTSGNTKRGGKGIAKHNSGAMSFATRRFRLEKKLGRKPTLLEAAKDCYTNKKTGEIQDGLMKEMLEKADRLLVEKETVKSQQPGCTDPKLTVDEVDCLVTQELGLPVTRGRLYGVGTMLTTPQPTVDPAVNQKLAEMAEQNKRMEKKNQKTNRKFDRLVMFLKAKLGDDGLDPEIFADHSEEEEEVCCYA